MTSLAWFSSVTHLSTLTNLRGYLKARGSLRILRVTCMLLLLILLVVALLPTGLSNWPVLNPYTAEFFEPFAWQPGIPAKCYFKEIGGVENKAVILSIAFLVTNYLTRTSKLFDISSDATNKLFKRKPSHAYKKLLKYFSSSYIPADRSLSNESLGTTGANFESNCYLCIRNSSLLKGSRSLFFSALWSFYVIGKVVCDLVTTEFWEVCYL